MKTIITSARQIFPAIIIAVVFLAAVPATAQNNASGTEEKTQSVKLLSFTGTQNGAKADLKWVTEAEVNVSHFIIEKSTDGVNYSDAGVFFAYGTGNDKTNYSFSVNQPSNTGAVYYRLFVTGNNGKGFYSEPCIVKSK